MPDVVGACRVTVSEEAFGKVRLRYNPGKHPGKFMFCVGNPKGITLAKDIANYILEHM